MSDKVKELPEKFQNAVEWKKGNVIAEFEDGGEYEHHWGRTINSGDNSLYTTLTQMYNPLYFNEPYAKDQGHPTTVVNPFLVFNTVLGLSVEDLSEAGNGPFVGINELTFHEPVYEGDTLTAKSVVLGKRFSESRPGSAIVTWKTQGFKQTGELVVEYTRSNLLTS